MKSHSVDDKVKRAFFSFKTQLKDYPNIDQCENPWLEVHGNKNILYFLVAFGSTQWVKDEDIGVIPYEQTGSVFNPPTDTTVDIDYSATKYLPITVADNELLRSQLSSLEGVKLARRSLFLGSTGEGPNDGYISYAADLQLDEDVAEATLHQALALIVAFLKKAGQSPKGD